MPGVTSERLNERTQPYASDKVSIAVYSTCEGDGTGDRPALDLHPGSWCDPTGTTIITFLMVFLIQATQNRDAEAVQVKLDELLRATTGAHNALLDLEELEERELDRIRAGYCRLAEGARADLRGGGLDTGVPEVA